MAKIFIEGFDSDDKAAFLGQKDTPAPQIEKARKDILPWIERWGRTPDGKVTLDIEPKQSLDNLARKQAKRGGNPQLGPTTTRPANFAALMDGTAGKTGNFRIANNIVEKAADSGPWFKPIVDRMVGKLDAEIVALADVEIKAVANIFPEKTPQQVREFLLSRPVNYIDKLLAQGPDGLIMDTLKDDAFEIARTNLKGLLVQLFKTDPLDLVYPKILQEINSLNEMLRPGQKKPGPLDPVKVTTLAAKILAKADLDKLKGKPTSVGFMARPSEPGIRRDYITKEELEELNRPWKLGGQWVPNSAKPWPPEAGDGPNRLLVRAPQMPEGFLILRFPDERFASIRANNGFINSTTLKTVDLGTFPLRSGDLPVGNVEFEIATIQIVWATVQYFLSRLLASGPFWCLDGKNGKLCQFGEDAMGRLTQLIPPPVELSSFPKTSAMFQGLAAPDEVGDGPQRVIMLRTSQETKKKTPLVFLLTDEELLALANTGTFKFSEMQKQLIPANYEVATLKDMRVFPPAMLDSLLNREHWVQSSRRQFLKVDRQAWENNTFRVFSAGSAESRVRVEYSSDDLREYVQELTVERLMPSGDSDWTAGASELPDRFPWENLDKILNGEDGEAVEIEVEQVEPSAKPKRMVLL